MKFYCLKEKVKNLPCLFLYFLAATHFFYALLGFTEIIFWVVLNFSTFSFLRTIHWYLYDLHVGVFFLITAILLALGAFLIIVARGLRKKKFWAQLASAFSFVLFLLLMIRGCYIFFETWSFSGILIFLTLFFIFLFIPSLIMLFLYWIIKKILRRVWKFLPNLHL